MSQNILKDPIVSVGPVRTGTGTGTLTVDKLTHFTTAQDYSVICIATSPNTTFSVAASDDGPVGIATVGTQFFDENLKIFLTIQQGVTPFIIGDQFTFSVINGTDLNQANIDTYDELPQKNFGVGSRGFLKGDHSLRFSDTLMSAYAYCQGLKFLAVTPGAPGNALSVQALGPVAASSAIGTFESLTFTAPPGAAGNGTEVILIDGGGSVSTVTPTVTGNVISVVLGAHTNTFQDVVTALNADAPTAALITTSTASGTGATVIGAGTTSPVILAGGDDEHGQVGHEAVRVSGSTLQLFLTSGVSTVATMLAAFNASSPAVALATAAIIGNGSDVMYAPGSSISFQDGLARWYSFNQHELTDPSDFYEGNASLLIQDLKAQGAASFAKRVVMLDKLGLLDGTAESGPVIDNVQKFLNHILTKQKAYLKTADGSSLRWQGGQLFAGADLDIEMPDLGVQNSFKAANFPISIADGNSLWFTLNPTQDNGLLATAATSVGKGNFDFRLCTRVGTKLIWFNGTVSGDGDVFKVGSLVDYGPHVRGLLTGGGTLSSDQTTIGLLTWSADLFLEMVGTDQKITVPASNITLTDGQAAYLSLSDPFVNGSQSFTIAAASTSDLARADRYWVFKRTANIIYVRNGQTLVPGEEQTIGTEISADVFAFMGSQGETDNSPSYTTGGHTAGAVANAYVADGQSLTKAIKVLDSQAGALDAQENQDRSLQLLGGGSWSWNSSTGVLTWPSNAFLMIEGLADSVNTILASSATLSADGKCAYVSINRSGAGGNLTVSVADVASVPLSDNIVVIARRIGGKVILRNGGDLETLESKKIHDALSDQTKTLLGVLGAADSAPNPVFSTSIANRYISDTDSLPGAIKKLDSRIGTESDLEAQDRSNLLVEGGLWNWTLGTTTLAWAADANVQVPGLFNTRNRIAAGSVSLPTDQDVAYVELNRSGTTAAALTVQVALISALVMDDNTYIIARRLGSKVIVGAGTLITDGQSVSLGASGSGSGGGGAAVIRLLNTSSSVLPTTTSVTIDGQTLVDGDLVLFTALTTGNNEIYKATVAGSTVTWTLQKLGQNQVTGAPTGGDLVVIKDGTAFANKLYEYDAKVTSSWIDLISSNGVLKDLSNLAGTTAINSTLAPATSGSANVGTASKPFGTTFTQNVVTGDTKLGTNTRYAEDFYLDAQVLTGGGTSIFSGFSFDTTLYKSIVATYNLFDPTTGVRRSGIIHIVADAIPGTASTTVVVEDNGTGTANAINAGVVWTAAMSGNIAQVSYTATTGNKTLNASCKRLMG